MNSVPEGQATDSALDSDELGMRKLNMALQALFGWETLVTLITLKFVPFTFITRFMFSGHVLHQKNFALEQLSTLLTV